MKNDLHVRHIIVTYQDPKGRDSFPEAAGEEHSRSHTEDEGSEWRKTSRQLGDGAAAPSTVGGKMISDL